ncbi:hypothetical protein MRX96_008359 [Rhipicephalus microplus]
MDDSDSDGEHYDDAPDDSDEEEPSGVVKPVQPGSSSNWTGTTGEKQSAASWVHTKLTTVDESGAPTVERRRRTEYDPLARNPLYCGAEFCPAWELRHLSRHYHPSVALFAERILRGQPVAYPGDPLQDFTLSRFLDRFVYRNPKAPGAHQPSHGGPGCQCLWQAETVHAERGSVRWMCSVRQYQQQVEANIPPEETFLYRYFKQERERRKAEKGKDEDKKKKDAKDDELSSDAESVASDDVDRVLDMFEPGR